MPSFLDVDTSKAVEPKAVPGDKEYKIRIIDFIEREVEGELVQVWESKAGPCFMPIFEIPSVPTAKEFNNYYPLPHDGMTEKERAKAEWRIEEFKRAFKVPKGKVELKKLIGNEAWAILGLRNEPEYGEQNFIKKLLVGK